MKTYFNLYFSGLILFSLIFSCTPTQKSNPTETMKAYEKGTYGYDLQFLQKHKKPVELKSGNARVLISPEFKGDAINSYNDGPVEDGSQMGPFYELETSSPALALKPNETGVYKQSTIHFEGTEEELNAICQQVFGVSIAEAKAVF